MGDEVYIRELVGAVSHYVWPDDPLDHTNVGVTGRSEATSNENMVHVVVDLDSDHAGYLGTLSRFRSLVWNTLKAYMTEAGTADAIFTATGVTDTGSAAGTDTPNAVIKVDILHQGQYVPFGIGTDGEDEFTGF